MVTGSTHTSHCATQPIYATVTDKTQCARSHLQKFSELIKNSLSFPELKNSRVFQFFQSCKHPVTNE